MLDGRDSLLRSGTDAWSVATEWPATLDVVPWVDEVVEAHGFGPMSGYIEQCWLPVLGPTATWLYRKLGAYVLTSDRTEIDTASLLASVGVTAAVSRNAPGTRALNRLIAFGVAELAAPSSLRVRRALAPLTQRRLSRLPETVRSEHLRILAAA